MAGLNAPAAAGCDRLRPDRLNMSRLHAIKPGVFVPGIDFLAMMAMPLLASLLRQSTENLARNLCFWTLLAVIVVILVTSHGGYRSARPASLRQQAGLVVNCFLAGLAALLAASVLLGHAHILARRWPVADIIVTPGLIFAWRGGLAKHLTQRAATAPPGGPVVISYDHYPEALSQALAEQQIAAQISGIFFLSPYAVPVAEMNNTPRIADIDALLNTIQTKNVRDIVFVHHPQLDRLAASTWQDLLSQLFAYPARIWMAFDISGDVPALLKHNAADCKIVPILTDRLVSSRSLTKRAFDIAAGSLLLITCLPLLVIVAALVKASGPGPVIFRQTRTGAHERNFTVLKFRTMVHDPARGFAQARLDDPRVTRIGRFLRRSSLDELLQLFNVIAGDMSLVGPRPHAPETQVEGINFENAVRLYRLRHRVKPGITGLAQIRGQRGETSAIDMLEQRLASDLEYIQSWSLGLDVLIMCKTVPLIFWQKNAC